MAPAVVVQATDQFSNVISGDTVTLSVENYPSGTVYSTFMATTDASGDATFTSVSLPTTGSYMVVATDGTVSSGNSNSFTVNPAAATTLVYTQQPSNAVAGATIAPNVVVDVEDEFGNVLAGDSSSVTLAVNDGVGSLNGTLTVQAQNGVATFSGLSLNAAGVYTLVASDANMNPIVSDGFTITQATATATVASAPSSIPYDGTSDVTYWATGTASGASGVANPTGMVGVVFYQGSSASGTPLSSPPVNPGIYTAVASYDGDCNYGSAQSTPVTFTIASASLPAWADPASAALWDATAHTLTVTGPTTIIADPGADAPIINASGSSAAVIFQPVSGFNIHIGGLNLSDGATATVQSLGASRSASNHSVLVIADGANNFSIDGTSLLNVMDNDMIVKNGDVSYIEGLILAARDVANGDSWDGTHGITSSIAQQVFNANGGQEFTSLGYARNGDLDNFNGSYATFGPGNEAVDGNAVLIKYTYVGDVDLNGTVDANDDGVFGNEYDGGATTGHHWDDGDMNGDGVIDANDDGIFGNYYGFGTPASPEFPTPL
jgi:hypothetical protein